MTNNGQHVHVSAPPDLCRLQIQELIWTRRQGILKAAIAERIEQLGGSFGPDMIRAWFRHHEPEEVDYAVATLCGERRLDVGLGRGHVTFAARKGVAP
jgi:hypothetical protein